MFFSNSYVSVEIIIYVTSRSHFISYNICSAFIADSCMRKFFSFRLRWNDGVYDPLLGNFNLENEGLRCCWWGEVKLIQNSSFLFHPQYSPRFPEKKVGKNTFRAFTGKLEKPINLRCRGGDASLGGWMILTSLENEQSASYRYALSLQIIFWRDVHSENYGEKAGFVSVVDKRASWVVLYVRHDEQGWLPSPSVCTKTCRKFVFTLFSPPLLSPLF